MLRYATFARCCHLYVAADAAFAMPAACGGRLPPDGRRFSFRCATILPLPLMRFMLRRRRCRHARYASADATPPVTLDDAAMQRADA